MTETTSPTGSPATPATSSPVSRTMTCFWIALVMFGIALYANQFVTLRRVKAVLLSGDRGEAISSMGSRAWDLVTTDPFALFSLADMAIGGAMVLALGYVALAEIRHGAATRLLTRAQRSDAVAYGLLALCAVVIARPYLNPGQVFMGDAETHLLRSWMVAEQLRDLQWPVWSNAWYGGFPLLEHYGPLYFIVTAVVTIAVGDIHLATKLILWGCHVGSVFVMFAFVRQAVGRRLPALIAALAYGLSFHRLIIILYQGDLQLSVLFLAYPGVLWLTERFLQTRRAPRFTFIALTLTLAALILNHHGYAFFGLVLLPVYVLTWVVASRERRDAARVLLFFATALVASVLVSAVLLAPFMLDLEHVRGMPNSAFPILVPNPMGVVLLPKLFTWSMFGDGTSIGYIGLSIGLCCLVALPYVVRRRDAPALALLACAVVSILMTRNRLQYNIKNVNFLMLGCAAFSGWALLAVEEWGSRSPAFAGVLRRWGPAFSARVAVVLLAILFVDLGPTTVQSVYREDYDFKQSRYGELDAMDDYRVIERQAVWHEPDAGLARSFDPNKLGIPSAYVGLHTPLGFFHEGAGRSFGYTAEMVKQVHRDLNHERVTDQTAMALYLMGVKRLVFRDRYRWFSPRLEPSPHYTMVDGAMELTHASPLILSTRVIPSAEVEGFRPGNLIDAGAYFDPETFDYSDRRFRELVWPLMRIMNVNPRESTAEVLVAGEDVPGFETSSEPLTAEVLAFSSNLNRTEIRYVASGASMGRVALTYFPYLDVRVDDVPVPFHRSAMHNILVRLPAGEHTVTVRGVAPPFQRAMAWVSVAALMAVVCAPSRVFRLLAPPGRAT